MAGEQESVQWARGHGSMELVAALDNLRHGGADLPAGLDPTRAPEYLVICALELEVGSDPAAERYARNPQEGEAVGQRNELRRSLSAATIGAPCEVVLIDPDRNTWVVRTAGPPLALADAEFGLSTTGGSAKQKQPAAAKALRWPALLLAVAFHDKAVRALRESPTGKELIQACREVFQPVPA